ncbi:MAG TPA: hypothetical protein VLB90_09685, partial [Pseudomonadales bacterium]|nr:hypothetical protein [Pseudomonadales bacterium]
YEHGKIREEAKNIRKSKLDNLDLQRAKMKLSKERDMLHARNSRRKIQVTVSKAARSEQIGVSDIKLVVDNSSKIMQVDWDGADDELDTNGWSMD